MPVLPARLRLLACLLLAASGIAAAAPPAIVGGTIDEFPVLNFDQPMLTWGNGNATAPDIRIEPALPCSWEWDNDTTLQCHMADASVQPVPATSYRVVASGLWSQAGEQLPAGSSVTMETPRPLVEANVASWKDGWPTFMVWTNQRTTIEQLRTHVRLESATGRAVDATWTALPDPMGNGQRWDLTANDRSGHDVLIALHVLPGLQGTEGPLPGRQDKVLEKALAGESFAVTGHPCGYMAKPDPRRIECTPGDQLRIRFSAPLSDVALKRLSESLPPGLFWVDVHKEGNRYYDDQRDSGGIWHAPGDQAAYQVLLPRRSIDFAFPAGLTDTLGRTLAHTQGFTIVTGDLRPSLQVEPTSALLLAPDAQAVQRLEGINLDRGSVEFSAIGSELTHSQAQFAIAKNNLPQPISPPDLPPDIRQNGGLVDVSVSTRRKDGSPGQGERYQVAYAGFQVVASRHGDSRHGDEVSVWVTRWQGAQPVAHAKVELLVQAATGLQTLATAMSDADGYAQVSVPANKATPNALVRVSANGRRSVMRLEDRIPGSRSEQEERWGWSSWESTASMRQWGVSDRPLYQPGETVRYRLWVRDRRLNHLVAPRLSGQLTVELSAADSREKPLQTAQVAADGLGGISGEFRLPADAADDRYCITVSKPASIEGQGDCFQVTRFEPAELWARIAPLVALVHAGEKLAVEVEAGFYSGGPAGLADVKLQSDLSEASPAQAYPQFAAYAFGGSNGYRAESFAVDQRDPKTGADGIARMSLPTAADPQDQTAGNQAIPFGFLLVDAVVNYPGHAGIASEMAHTLVARYRRYVGLQVPSYRLEIGAPLKLQAVVISDAGVLLRDQAVHVTIEQLPKPASDGTQADTTSAPSPIAECTVPSGGSSDCKVALVDGRRYRLVASSEGAASATLEREAGPPPPPPPPVARHEPTLSLERMDQQNPYDQTPIAASSVRVRVSQPYARARLLLTMQHEQILRHWTQALDSPQTVLDIPIDPGWTPGATLTVVAVDASRAQDAPPGNEKIAPMYYAELRLPILQHQPPQPIALVLPAHGAPGSEVSLQLHNPRTTAVHATIAMIDEGLLVRVQPGDFEQLEPAGDRWLGVLKQWSTASWFGFVGWNTPSLRSLGFGGLDGIVVTGSRVRRVDAETASPAIMLDRKGVAMSAGARLRTNFLETAYWQPDLLLAPGQTRSVKIKLPDNLTEWRAIVWAADENDGFARSEAKLTSSLPVEARANAPTHLYAGDSALAEISARGMNAGSQTIRLQGKADGAGIHVSTDKHATLPRGSLLQQRLSLQPGSPGTIALVAQAGTAGGRDATEQEVTVADTEASERVTQVGWLAATPLSIAMPKLAVGAHDPQLTVKLGRVDALLSAAWTSYLRDYVHRCWEQTLSRAIGARLAVMTPRDTAAWPGADAEVQAALVAAPGFVDGKGRFGYFKGTDGKPTAGSDFLTAYTLDAFAELKALGQPVPDALADRAAQAIEEDLDAIFRKPREKNTWYASEIEAILGGSLADRERLDARNLKTVWNDWDHLSWYARSQLVRALAAQPATADLASEGLARLRNAGIAKGERRVLVDGASSAYEMGSLRRDQCAIIRTLTRLDPSEPGRKAIAALERGLFDLYAGGSWDSDIQTSAQCLLALHAVNQATGSGDEPVQMRIDIGSQHADLALAADRNETIWFAPAGERPASLALTRADSGLAPAAFVANLAYRRDQRIPAPVSTGLHLDRSYEVLRDKRWIPVDSQALHEGDWVRVSLVVSVNAFRHFVAVSDPVPGGWVPEDVNLKGVAGMDLQDAGYSGSWWFGTRQLGTSVVRMYAEYLPPGRYAMQYFAQVRHSGHYFAPPATAELMYGEASYARTAPETVTIVP